MGAQGNAILIDNFVTEEVVAAASTFEYTIDIIRFNAEGFVSLQVKLAGAGTMQADYNLSNNGVDFMEPSGTPAYTPIFTGLVAGDYIYSFEPLLTRYIRLIFTGAGADVTLSGWLALQ